MQVRVLSLPPVNNVVVAQLVERDLAKIEATGSRPVYHTKKYKRVVGRVAIAPDCRSDVGDDFGGSSPSRPI